MKKVQQLERIEYLIQTLAHQQGPTPITDLWHLQVDPQWDVAINGAPEPRQYGGVTVAPYSFYVTFNGWPWAKWDISGGDFGHGDAANMDTFIAALDRCVVTAAATIAERAEQKERERA